MLRRDVVGEREAGGGGRVVRDDDGTDLESGVVIDRDVGRPVEDLEEPRVIGGRGGDVVEHVVANEHALFRLTRVNVVGSQQSHAASDVTHDVVRDGHVLDDGPGRLAALIARGQDDPVELRVGAELKLIKALKLTGAVTRGLTDGAADWGVSMGLALRF